MSKMKSLAEMYALTSIAIAMGMDRIHGRGNYIETETDREEREKRMKEAQEKINIAKGLKKFYYGDVVVWALNQKSADRKFKSKYQAL